MAKRRVVLTGAAGYVAQRMFGALTERWDVVPLDVRTTDRNGKPVPGCIVSDLTQPDRNLYRQHFRGADAVIHCGFVRAPGMTADTWQDNSDAKFQAEHANVALAYNVYRVALEEGVRNLARHMVASGSSRIDRGHTLFRPSISMGGADPCRLHAVRRHGARHGGLHGGDVGDRPRTARRDAGEWTDSGDRRDRRRRQHGGAVSGGARLPHYRHDRQG